MAYADLTHLLAAAGDGWTELAQRAAADARVEPALVQAVAEGGDTSAWGAELVALAGAALQRMDDALERASKHADTYLFPRYRQVMPLAANLVQGSSLPEAVATIALRRLYGAALPEDLRRATAWADDYLAGLAKGTLSLGAADVQVAQPAGKVAARSRPSAFDWDGY